MRLRVGDRRFHRRRLAGTAETHIDDFGTVICRPDDARRDIAGRTATVSAKNFDRQNARLWCHTCDANAVVCFSCDGARHVGAVTMSVVAPVTCSSDIHACRDPVIQFAVTTYPGIDDSDVHAITRGQLPT